MFYTNKMKRLEHRRTHGLRCFFLLALTTGILLSGSLSAQKSIQGTVFDEQGEVIAGATVQVETTKTGTITDVNGRFSIRAADGGTLKVSYLGYITQMVPIKGRAELSISMEPDTKALDEVVVVGYGTVLKSDLTGAVSRLKGEKMEEKPYSSIEQMLQGRTAGVQITQNTGALGGGITFSIRGANSTSGDNQPLVVIDGYPVESGENRVDLGAENSFVQDLPGANALSMLNPNDIESIEILKDASSTAIYGSRGANGVVMVTTKLGKEGREKIEYSFRTDMSFLPKKIKVLDTPDFLAYSNEAYMDKADGSQAYSLSLANTYIDTNTNWQDLIYQTGYSQNHQLSISGGDKKLRYALGMGYLTQTGIVKNTAYDRGTVNLNLNREVNPRFSFGVNLGGSMSLNKSVSQASRNASVSASVVNAALRVPPIYRDYDEDYEVADFGVSGMSNPLILVTKASDKMKLTTARLTGFANYKILPELTFKVRLGINNSLSERQYYMPRGTTLGDLSGGYAYNGNVKKTDYLSEFTLNYLKVIRKKHSINAVGGYTWQNWQHAADGIAARGFINDKYLYYNLYAASTVDKPVNSTQEWSLASLLGRVNYVYDKRYLSTLTLRYDGSTRLARGNKWDLFPSVALGWNIHNERFMKKQKLVSELKLRTSYGLSGNQAVGVGSTLAKYATGTGVVNEQVVTIYNPANLENLDLHWETTAQYNAGLDIALLKNRISFGIDAYRKVTSDLLITLPLPGSSGYGSYVSNTGRVENKGLEFDLSAHILTGKLKWKASGNISFNRNKILALDGQMPSFMGPSYTSVASQVMHIAQAGYPIGAFYGYKIIGIYQTQEEIDSGPVDPANPSPGSFKYADISGPDGVPDGEITDYDRTIVGNPYPDFILGVSNDFTWRNFSLNVFIQGSFGQDVINTGRYYLDGLSRLVNSNVSQTAYDNRWTGPGTSNTYPAASTTTGFQGRFTDFIVEDASYIRLKSLTLAYNIRLKKRKVIQGCKIFATATNLFTVTSYTGYDPEINSRGQNSMSPGVDGGAIPQFRSFSAGFNVNF
jgi:TonB-linked SusC/RagA family outer membrane protein